MYARGVSRPSLAPYRSAPDSFGPLHVELAPYGLGLLGAYVMPATHVVIATGPHSSWARPKVVALVRVFCGWSRARSTPITRASSIEKR